MNKRFQTGQFVNFIYSTGESEIVVIDEILDDDYSVRWPGTLETFGAFESDLAPIEPRDMPVYISLIKYW